MGRSSVAVNVNSINNGETWSSSSGTSRTRSCTTKSPSVGPVRPRPENGERRRSQLTSSRHETGGTCRTS